MKIWVIGRNYPCKNNNMSGSFELEQAKMLAKYGNEVCYLACNLHYKRKGIPRGFHKMEEDNVTIYTFSKIWFPERLRFVFSNSYYKNWKYILNRVESLEGLPEIIHVHYPTMLTSDKAVFEYKDRGVKVFATEHWTKVQKEELNKNEQNQLANYVKKSNAIICVGEPLKKAVQRIAGQKDDIFVIPNVVTKEFCLHDNNESNCFTFVVTGRMVKHKQFDKILLAYSNLVKLTAATRLVLVGDGPERNKLEQLSEKLHLADRVKFTGSLSRKETAKQVSQSDCLICYSNFETFGVPVIEAWACGKPVIASNRLGFLEYWTDSLGVIVDVSDTKALEHAMEKMILSCSKYDRNYISHYAQENFGENAICSKIISLYKNR